MYRYLDISSASLLYSLCMRKTLEADTVLAGQAVGAGALCDINLCREQSV